MKRKSRWIVAGIICILTFALIFSGQVFANQTTVIGKVNDSYQIVTEEGIVYEVADTDMGNDMLNNIGKTVEATGTVTEEEGVKLINVTSYTVRD
ncbi:MAG: hypothetical protein ABIK98_07850 [Pseudomonadota bacterium]|uniref:DUF1344 domain-containing protein n=1 Tax=Candidatus Desulfatibia profunda TaxID=2841695 RepID=A0A8J6TKX5_9BACT|nr:hypothetical protein [Candidatus Desulfatibia profunda]MBL7179423.1 hypothetical protein [Desulfobacterales bacterium]